MNCVIEANSTLKVTQRKWRVTMSWSVSAIGKSAAVRSSVAEQFTKNTCSEPEESVRQAAARLLDACLAAQDGVGAVKVIASGSQWAMRLAITKTGVSNHLSIIVEPQHGFLE